MAAKWKWAGKSAQMGEERLARRATFWRDSEWWRDQPRGASAYGVRPMRARPGHFLRWEDDVRKFADYNGWDTWQSVASDNGIWDGLCDQFVQWAWR